MKKKKTLNEIVDVNGSKVFIENGEVKIQFSEAIQESEYMSVEDARRITHEAVKMEYQFVKKCKYRENKRGI